MVDMRVVIEDPEDGGTHWGRFSWGIWVGMVKNHRENGVKWGGSKKGSSGKFVEKTIKSPVQAP